MFFNHHFYNAAINQPFVKCRTVKRFLSMWALCNLYIYVILQSLSLQDFKYEHIYRNISSSHLKNYSAT